MSLIRFNTDFNNWMFPRFAQMMDRFFDDDALSNRNFASATLPAVNIKETAEDFQVELAAPGLQKEDFKIELENHLLKISSEKKTEHEEKNEDGKYARREFSYQSFQRAFTLPSNVDSEKIAARYEGGILTVIIPKREEAKEKPARTIAIG
ncbi:MAG: Hsp20/alpha crystallin family protein [Microscillaceae bacterium]